MTDDQNKYEEPPTIINRQGCIVLNKNIPLKKIAMLKERENLDIEDKENDSRAINDNNCARLTTNAENL